MSDELAWGRRYAVVDPAAYRIDYVINPYMDPARQPDPARARDEWDAMVAALRAAGADVEVIDPLSQAPDMVYAMNLGLAVAGAVPRVVLSHMRHPQRRVETPAARAWFEAQGFATAVVGADGDGPCFEAGDAFPFAGELVLGHGPRSDLGAATALADLLGVRVRPVRLTRPGVYHLDLAFCPLDAEHALVCPDALDDVSARALLDLVPSPVLVDLDEAVGTWCANSVVVGRTVLMPGCPPRVRARLEHLGFDVVLVELSQFHLGGGSIRCLTNPLDIVVGRDLDVVTAPGAGSGTPAVA